MKKIKIGIPRALIYNKYGVFWKHFFTSLGCKIILSPETYPKILDLEFNEYCLPCKIYLNHILYLSKTCDYIIVSRNCYFEKKCYQNRYFIEDLNKLILSSKIIEYTNSKYHFFEYFKIGFKLTKNPIKIIYSYLNAKIMQKNYDINKQNEEKNKINKSNKKILIISEYYNIKDVYESKYIINYLEKNNIIPIFSNNLEFKTAHSFSEYFENKLYLNYEKQSLGSFNYYKYIVDGIIMLSTENCYIDEKIFNFININNKEMPIINIIIYENINKTLLETTLESFIDIIKNKK